VSRTIGAVRDARLPASLQAAAEQGIRAQGAGFPVPKGTAATDASALTHALATGITDATRPALLVAAGFVMFGAVLSLLLPKTPPVAAGEPFVETLEALEPVEVDPAVLRGLIRGPSPGR
jgi:hypothetical protein